MRGIFVPGKISGSVRVPASKSQAHRALICAALAGESEISGFSYSEDMSATLGALKAMGADFDVDPGTGESDGVVTFRKALEASDGGSERITVDCGESASTLRFMIPLSSALGKNALFVGRGRLPRRTTTLYEPLLTAHGVKMEYPKNGDFLPLAVSGKLTGGEFPLRGDVSSQFVTGMLFALSVAGSGSVRLTTKLESRPYAKLTVDMLDRFGIDVEERGDSYIVKGGKFRPTDFAVDGDCSQAAFFAVAAAINGNVTIKGIDPDTKQGDFAVFDIVKRFGGRVTVTENGINVSAGELHASDIDASDIPDLVPALAVLAAFSAGETQIYNAGRLRLKESDRIASTADLIRSLGGEVSEMADGLVISGRRKLSGGFAEAFGDHRIAMAAAAASVGCIGEVVVDDMSCTAKSYPDFTRDFRRLF